MLTNATFQMSLPKQYLRTGGTLRRPVVTEHAAHGLRMVAPQIDQAHGCRAAMTSHVAPLCLFGAH